MAVDLTNQRYPLFAAAAFFFIASVVVGPLWSKRLKDRGALFGSDLSALRYQLSVLESSQKLKTSSESHEVMNKLKELIGIEEENEREYKAALNNPLVKKKLHFSEVWNQKLNKEIIHSSLKIKIS